jgi:prepilin-type N-terminal cleavage/methylation domain-containing protein
MMILRRLRVINCNQKGFTLAELLVAMAITALIGSAVATATYQVVKVNALSTNHQIAVSQVQNAVNSISRDTQQSQQVIPKSSADIALPLDTIPVGSTTISYNLITGNIFQVQWINWDGNTTYQVTYSVDSNGTLKRLLKINGTLTSTTSVAQNIKIASGNWDTYARVLTLQITAIVGASNPATETRTFQIIPRPAQ